MEAFMREKHENNTPGYSQRITMVYKDLMFMKTSIFIFTMELKKILLQGKHYVVGFFWFFFL